MPKYLLIILLQFILISTVLAWGKDGHIMTADIAYAHLTQAAKDSLKFYLGTMTLQQAGTWMDEVRSDTTLSYLKPYHYINIDSGAQYDPKSTNNIISELQKVVRELKDRQHHTAGEIAMDLKILVHLVGDLHQPLHTGYGTDRGGNDIRLTVLGDSSNLHRVWDSDIIRREHITTKELDKELGRIKKKEYKDGDVVVWMNESRAELGAVYDFHGNIDRQYLDRNKELVKLRLRLAGLRVAWLLNDIFSQ